MGGMLVDLDRSLDLRPVEAISKWGIRFTCGGTVTDIGTRELKDVGVELEKIAEGGARLAAVAAELAARMVSLAGPLDSMTAFELHSLERFALLRALDHLRNLGHEGELMTLRDRILLNSAVEPVSYRLRLVADARTISFWSFSREYERDDRLVRNSSEEFRVVEVREGDPAVLLVDEWKRPRSS